MTESLEVLTDRILMSKVQGIYDDADIDRIVSIALRQAATISQLARDLEASRSVATTRVANATTDLGPDSAPEVTEEYAPAQ